MRKTLLIVGVGLLLVTLLVTSAFARGFGWWGAPAPTVQAELPQLTDEQKKELEETYSKMWDLRKELIEKQVKLGLLTEAEGNYLIERMELAKKYRETDGSFGYGYGYGPGGCGGFGPGMMGGPHMGGYGRMGRGARW